MPPEKTTGKLTRRRVAALLGSAAVLMLAGRQDAWAGGVQTLEEIVVTDTRPENDSIAPSDTATEGTVLKDQLDSRPVYREGELLENVPGLIVTQHSGEGKANQYYLRGFNLDHGTDVAVTLDDMPVNLPTHGHGQGYADLNFMIPELVSGMKYEKGPYFADQGDFSTAGAVQIGYLNKLDQDLTEIGGGSFGYGREITAMSRPVGQGTLLAAFEAQHLDGPWIRSDDYYKANGVLRYSEGTDSNGWAVTAMAYGGKWNATNQIPERAVEDGQISYFGTEDPTDGGYSQRYSLSGKIVQTTANGQLKANVYVIASELDLFNDFTFFLTDPIHGDQFHQHDARVFEGGKISYTLFGKLAGLETENTFGAQVRNDTIHLGLFQTEYRQYLSTDRADQVDETSVGAFYENKTQWSPKIRTVIGFREDMIHASDQAYDMTDFNDGLYDTPYHSNAVTNFKPSPKGDLILGPWSASEIYLSAGEGFHSNDVRTAAYPVETEFLSSGPVSVPTTVKYPLMERASGYEIGARTDIVPNLQTSLALFQLNLSSEQVFDGDAALNSPSGPSTRRGIEFANFYSPVHGIIFDADLAVSRARFNAPVYDGTESIEAGNAVTCCTGRYIAGSPNVVIGSGLEIDDIGNWFGGLQYRYYGPRPLTNDGGTRSPRTSLVNVRVGYKLLQGVSVRLDIDNLLDSKMQDIAYYYVSRLPSEPAAGVADIHFHAAEPLGFRASLVARW
jgi:hypothetical protein